MQTQCPKCETQFRVTDKQLEAAEGQVRCSLCDEVFKALTVNEESNSGNAEQDTDLPEINTEFERTPDSELKTTSSTEIDADVIHNASSKLDSNNIVEFDSAKDNHSEDKTTENNKEYSDEFSDQLDTQESDREEIYLNEDDSISNSDAIVDNNKQEQHLDLFQDENHQDSPQIIPDELRDGVASNNVNIGATFAWTSGILLLSTTLVVQYFWLNRDQFVTSPKFQALVEKTCLTFDCSKLTIRDPAHIELLTRNVFSHPDEKDALMINIALQNNAKFSQPYPVLQINFSDVRGGNIVARRFTPSEYLAEYATEPKQKSKPLLQPGSSADFNLEIEDPGKQAITYEFTFL